MCELQTKLSAGERWTTTGVFRVGDESRVRGSTVPGGENRIVVSHRMSVEIRYQVDGNSERRASTVTFPVNIDDVSSVHRSDIAFAAHALTVLRRQCCALAGSVILPPYTPIYNETPIKRVAKGCTLCLCEYSSAELFGMYGEAIEEGGARRIEQPQSPAAPVKTLV